MIPLFYGLPHLPDLSFNSMVNVWIHKCRAEVDFQLLNVSNRWKVSLWTSRASCLAWTPLSTYVYVSLICCKGILNFSFDEFSEFCVTPTSSNNLRMNLNPESEPVSLTGANPCSQDPKSCGKPLLKMTWVGIRHGCYVYVYTGFVTKTGLSFNLLIRKIVEIGLLPS